MRNVILRRRKLGKTSTNGIVAAMEEPCAVVRNWLDQFPVDTTTVFRWGCTSNVPEAAKVYNKAKAIHLVGNKLEFRRVLNEHKLCPATWFDRHVPIDAGKVVLRTAVHAQGRGLWVFDANDINLELMMRKLGPNGFYVNEFIPKVAEYRVFVGFGRAVWVARKTPGNPDDVAWNVAKGGRFDNVRWGDWPLKVVKTAIEAFNLSGLDYGGVDVMVSEDGKCYVLEINSAPSQTSPYRQQCVAKLFDWVLRNGGEHIPLSDKLGDWKKFGHPCLHEKVWKGDN